MLVANKLIKFLSKVKYEPIEHKIVYTAYDKAQTLKIPEKIVGKTLVIKMNGNFALVLIQANKILDKAKFKKAANNWSKKINQKAIKEIGFATEVWMKKNLKGVKVGAIPPFGNLFKLPAFIDKALQKEKEIILNGGNYNSSIKIKQRELKKIDFIQGNFSKAR